MASPIQTALFFTLIMLTTCNVQKQFEQLSKERNPFVAELTDFTLNLDQVNSRIAQRINALIQPHGDQNNDHFWFDLLSNKVEFKFAHEDKNLNEETTIARLGEFIDSSFPELSTLNKNDSHESLRAEYLVNLNKIYDELRRLMRREMVTQFVEISTVDGSKKDKITFFDSIPASALTKLIQKSNEFLNEMNIDMQAQLTDIEEAIKEVTKRLKDEFFPAITTLTNMYLNPILTMLTESKSALMISQLDSSSASNVIVDRIGYILSLLGQVSKGEKSTVDLEGLFNMFEPFILASKSGSSFGSLKFRRMIPEIVQKYLATISKYVSSEKSFSYAKRYLASIVTVSSHVEIDSFFQELTQKNFNKYDISDDSSDDFMENVIKVLDVINRVQWFDGMSEWWSNMVVAHFTQLQINPEIIENNELPKVMFIQNNLKYTEKPEFYEGLYDLVVRFMVDNGENLSKTEWVFTFSEFLDSVSELNKEDVPEDLMTIYEFSKEWYFWIKLTALAYRADVDETTNIRFVNILNDNGKTNEELPSWVRFRTFLFPRCQKVGIINKPMSDFKALNGNKLSAKDAKGATYLLKLIAKEKIPVSELFKYNISENKVQQQEDRNGKGGIQRKQVEIGVKAGRAEGKLDLVKKKKTENKIVIPEEKVVEEVKIPEVVIEHVSPKKEESPNKEILNLKTVEEILAEKKEEKKKEDSPIKEEVHEIDEDKDDTNNNVKEESPIQHPVIEIDHKEETPKVIEQEEEVITLPKIDENKEILNLKTVEEILAEKKEEEKKEDSPIKEEAPEIDEDKEDTHNKIKEESPVQLPVNEDDNKEETPKVIEEEEKIISLPKIDAYYKEETPKVGEKEEEFIILPKIDAYYKEATPKVGEKEEKIITLPKIDAYLREETPKDTDKEEEFIVRPKIDAYLKEETPKDTDKEEKIITLPKIDAYYKEETPKVGEKEEEFITLPKIDAYYKEATPITHETTVTTYYDKDGNLIPNPDLTPTPKDDSPKKPIQSPKIVKDVQEFDEEDEEDDSATDIKQNDSPIHHDTPTANAENIIHSVKGQLSPEEQDNIRLAPDLVNYAQRVETVIDPVTGDVTEYIYIQVVPKNSPCYDSVFE